MTGGMKKLINDAGSVVVDALRGVGAAHPDRLRVDLEHRIVYRADARLGAEREAFDGAVDPVGEQTAAPTVTKNAEMNRRGGEKRGANHN